MNLKYLLKSFFVLMFFLILDLCASDHSFYDETLLPIQECLLPSDHPLRIQLNGLFQDSKMFQSQATFRKAGFIVNSRAHRGCMVARHPRLRTYVFKKFVDSISQQSQIQNYRARITGARLLGAFIKDHQLKHIVVPQKWLYRLPSRFSHPITKAPSYILVAEWIDLCSIELSQKAYYSIPLPVLNELCLVVYRFRGLDSIVGNMPFTKNNKIAFVDTERWNWKREGYLARVLPLMSKDRRAQAISIFKKLEQDLQ